MAAWQLLGSVAAEPAEVVVIAVGNLVADYSRHTVLHTHRCIHFAVDRRPGCTARILAARTADNPHIAMLAVAGCSIAHIVADYIPRTAGTVGPVETIAHLAGKYWRSE